MRHSNCDKPKNNDTNEVLHRIRVQINEENVRVTQHAHQKMVKEGITLKDVLEAVIEGQIIENYTEHLRGPCCLINGTTSRGRPLHIVCTTNQPALIIITVYEPKPPKWINPVERRKQK